VRSPGNQISRQGDAHPCSEQEGCLKNKLKIASRVRYLIVLVGLIVWSGCKGGVDKTLVEVVEERYPVESTGSLRVKNIDGVIRLYGSERPEMHIKATKKAYSAERLRAISVQVSSQPDALAIETIFPPRKKWSLRDRSGVVDYIIVMPQHLKVVEAELVNGEISIDGLRGGSARARLVNGRISARNSFANLDYDAKNGAIDFYYNWWEPSGGAIKASIPNGPIGVFVPRAASFYLQAETQGGSIIGNLIEGDVETHAHRKKIARSFGSGGATFHLSAINGNIQIRGY
jgi:hypothetical protein